MHLIMLFSLFAVYSEANNIPFRLNDIDSNLYQAMKNGFRNIGDQNELDNELDPGMVGKERMVKCKGNKCACNAGYVLHENNKVCVPICENECVNGYCFLPNTCACFPGYKIAVQNSSVCLPVCSEGCGQGDCVSPGNCVCRPGYSQSPLTKECMPLCEQRCTNGFCHRPNKCKCNHGYKKLDNTEECVPKCTGGCVNGICSHPEVCMCKLGYKKDFTDPKSRRCIPKCQPACVNAICTSPNYCQCNQGYIKDANVIAGYICVHINLINLIE